MSMEPSGGIASLLAGMPAGMSAGMSMMPGAPGTMMTAAPGQPGMTAPGPIDSTAQMALSALDQLAPREPSGETSMARVGKALDLAQRLIVTVLPQISQWNAKLAKDLHVIGRQLADARINLGKEETVGPPPSTLLGSIGDTGIPGGM